MKIVTSILFMLLTLLSTSCGGDDDSSNNNGSSNAFSVKMNGVDYNPAFIDGFIIGGNNTITISGSESNGNNVVLNFPISVEAGDTFPAGVEFIASFDSSDGGGCVSQEGTLNITSHDVSAKRVAGSFNFSGQSLNQNGPDCMFTEGSFEVTYSNL